MPAWMMQHVAGMASADGIDVDASSRLSVWLASLTGASESLPLPIRSIWLPADTVRAPRITRLIDETHLRQPDLPPTVVLTISGSGVLRDVARSIIPLLGLTRDWSVAVGLPPSTLRGGRPHLVQLGAIKRFIEEWDLGVAIDLAGRFDPTWEAEAAISRLGARLRLLRMSSSAPSRSAIGRDRVACRALHTAIDRVERLDIALASPAPVPFPVTPRAAARCAERAADYICERALLHAQALREGIDRFEGSPSPRGN